eukprot:TRINITY_DN40134_c2_g1_i1.p1 TRINITY_DN40134_c2_g1~~TRINITY_DN40134_c2_g1_i1.p1  ORF type:complete len:221 (+),score=39.39 TRINITY_DN40134_c2_g1_i1:54-716(+)
MGGKFSTVLGGADAAARGTSRGSSLDSCQQKLQGLIEAYRFEEEHIPARLTPYLVIGGLHHAARPELLKNDFGVTHVFSCIHSAGEMIMGEEFQKQREAEKAATTEARSIQEVLALERAKCSGGGARQDAEDASSSSSFTLMDYYGGYDIRYRGVDAEDQDGYDMLGRHRSTFFEFCNAALQENPKACIYVHCAMGVNRSGVLAVSYVAVLFLGKLQYVP